MLGDGVVASVLMGIVIITCFISFKRGHFSLVFGDWSPGHIAHLNLRDDLLSYKEVIAEVILDVSISTCL